MQLYRKPELHIALFDLEDVILTASSPETSGDHDEEYTGWMGAPESVEYVNNLTVEEPLGVFDAHITGGNPVQEAMNTLYENFVNRM